MLESRLVGFYYEGHLKEVPVLFLFLFCCCPFYTSGFVERLSRNFQQQTRPRYQLKQLMQQITVLRQSAYVK